jgi:hypothetical protein
MKRHTCNKYQIKNLLSSFSRAKGNILKNRGKLEVNGGICRKQMRVNPKAVLRGDPIGKGGNWMAFDLGFGPGMPPFFLGWFYSPPEEAQKVTNHFIPLGFVAQGKAGIDGIPDPPPFFRLGEIPAAFELSDNSSDGALGNPDFQG